MKICLVDLYTEATSLPGQTERLIAAFQRLGVEIVSRFESGCEAIICGSVARHSEAARELEIAGGKMPLFVFCWDLYSWVFSSPRKWRTYKRFGDFIRRHAREVWVPSQCTADAVTNWLGEPGLSVAVVKSLVNYFNAPPEMEDEESLRQLAETPKLGYVLNVLRNTPDACCGWIELACDELGIPCVTPNHRLSENDWRLTLTGARFTVSAFREASTGGLSIMEGYYHGVPALLSDSPTHAGTEYMNSRAAYFAGNSFESLKERIAELWERPPRVENPAARAWVEQEYSYDAFAARVKERLERHL